MSQVGRGMGVAAVAGVVALVAACAVRPMTVSSHVERGLDFSQFETFDWGPADALPEGDPRLEDNTLFQDQFEGAVERQLAGLGYARAAGSPADLLIHYHAAIDRRLDVNRLDRQYGYCSEEGCPGGVIEYEGGTIVLDVVDARTGRLVWRGWAQLDIGGVLDDPGRLSRHVREAARRMLERFPKAHQP